MPPTFLYFLAFIIWVPSACLVWLLAGLLALVQTTRRTGLSLALAMAGTFPGVFLFQVAAAPIVIALLVGTHVFSKALDPGSSTTTDNLTVIIVSTVVFIVALAIMFLASLAGFFEGWSIGWHCGKGRSLRDAVGGRPPIRVLRRLVPALGRTFPSPSNGGQVG